MAAYLIMLQGHDPGARYKLRKERATTLGRSSQTDVSLVSPTVSRCHCEIEWIDGLWQIEDLNSKKGTIVNGEKITERQVLKPGDIIRLSTNVFKFDLLDEGAQLDEAMLALKAAALDGEIRQRAGVSNASLQAIRDRGRIDITEQRSERRQKRARPRGLLPNIVFILVGSVLVLVCTAAVYGVRLQRVRKLERTIRARRTKASEALAELRAMLADPDCDPKRAMDRAMALATHYAETPAAKEVIAGVLPQLKQLEADRQWAESDDVFKRVLEHERGLSFQAAVELIAYYGRRASDPRLKEFYDGLIRHVLETAQAAYAEREAAAKEALKEGDKETAILHYMEVIEQFGLPEYTQKAREAIAKIQGG
jgi:pSer/pThr/pTyr-binding forkhead associated (FHA) protein